jgi:aminoglycoside phosphotransferase family enzyme/predicted kinase
MGNPDGAGGPSSSDEAASGVSQVEIRAFLERPQTHGLMEPVACVETHISCVFLAGDLVYKMKKAVRLPFLDFSQLETRRWACAQELAINRVAAPALYRGLVAVCRDQNGRLSLDGPGAPVEWLVVMNRFSEDDLLSRMAQRQALDAAVARDLAEHVARYHDAADARPDHGGVAALTHTISTNEECMRPFLPDFCPTERIRTLTERSLDALRRVTGVLEARRAAGLVRRCHGDLHLNNICLYGQQLCLFDAIEFSEDFSCIDVLYDLAFLLMDLDRYGRHDLANIVLNRYLADRGDWSGLETLPLFLSLRAAIRMHVSLTSAAAHDGAPVGPTVEEARQYLELAEGYLAPPHPRLVAIGGLSGTGKSRLGARLAPLFGTCAGAVTLRSDVIRKRIMGRDWRDRLGPEGYSAEMTERTYRTLADSARDILLAGHSVIADAVFARQDERLAIEAVAKDCGVPFDGVWLEAPKRVLQDRVKARTGDASDATVEVLEKQLMYEVGGVGWHRLDTDAEAGSVSLLAQRHLGL